MLPKLLISFPWWQSGPRGDSIVCAKEPAHGGKECYGDALEARKCFLRECGNGEDGETEVIANFPVYYAQESTCKVYPDVQGCPKTPLAQ